jgi:hypothetical protein
MDFREALGRRPADIGPNTFELLPYQSLGYRSQVIRQNESPPNRFEQPGFNDTSFDMSNSAFGSGGICPLQQTVQTNWPVNSQLLMRLGQER